MSFQIISCILFFILFMKHFIIYNLCTSPELLKYPPLDILDQSQTATTCFKLNEWV